MIFTFIAWQTLSTAFFFTVLYFLHVLNAKFFQQAVTFSGHGPPSYPVIGCLISFYKNRRRLLDWYTQLLSQSPTNTIVVRRLGAKRTVVTANLKNVQYMLKTNFKNYPKGKPFTEVLGDFLGHGIFNVDGELWRTQRKLVSHEFSTNSLREYVMNTLREEVENRLLPVMQSVLTENKAVDLQDLLKRLTFDMICKVSLGTAEQHRSLDPTFPICPLAEAFDVSSEICARRGAATLSLSWKIKRLIRVGSERRLKEAVQEVHVFVSRVIRDKIRDMNERAASGNDDLLSRLILAGHDERTIRDLMISFIMAGRDTTSAAMTWLFWLLSQHPNIKQDLVREVELVVKKRRSNLDYESLKELKLLNACLLESMRLYPPVAWDSKHAVEDDVLPDGTIVKSGDRVTYIPYGMGRMEQLWGKDWFEFRPNRWLLEPEKGGTGEIRKMCPYKYPVFQAGPRDCIGKEMAFIQMKYVVASILRRFDVEPVNQGCPVFVPFLTAHMAGGLPVRIRKRNISKHDGNEFARLIGANAPDFRSLG
ncbi:cytochrome P450 94B3-like [Rhodamnia argentea]|uniref:Cytochrome P450 94B3-like n=1 Tax=Rhodamnia argentea TaxID=178133 RepID=A0A8B8P8A3_9MYRT|nr:cytochrome P450 94B3-like [Rhodamnia argentea]